MKFTKSSFKKCINLIFTFSLLLSLLVFSLPLWSEIDSFVMLEYLVIFAPRWWLLTIFIIISMFFKFLTFIQKCALPFFFYISISYLDFQIPNQIVHQEGASTSFKIVTANMGEGSQLKKLKQIIKYYRPDVLALQEIDFESVKELNEQYSFLDCEAGLCLVSKFPFKRTTALNRRMLDSWGNFSMSYQVSINDHLINLSNIHFETPREALLGIIKTGHVNARARKKIESRELEASIFGETIKGKQSLVLAGDFNMPDDDPLYVSNFSWLSNALNESGFGFNHTQYINWQGIPFFSFRIDHILYSKNIVARNVEVLGSLGGDHRPVLATLEIFN